MDPARPLSSVKKGTSRSYMLVGSIYITFEKTTLQRLRTDWRLLGAKVVVVVVVVVVKIQDSSVREVLHGDRTALYLGCVGSYMNLVVDKVAKNYTGAHTWAHGKRLVGY